MFDWDKDVEGLVNTDTLQHAPEADDRADRRNPSTFHRKLKLGLCVVGLGSVGVLAQAGVLPWKSAPDLVTAGFLPFHAAKPATSDMALQVLDAAQSNQFQIGLHGFSDADLLRYAAAAREDLAQAVAFMRPSHADAVALIALEIERRGL